MKDQDIEEKITSKNINIVNTKESTRSSTAVESKNALGVKVSNGNYTCQVKQRRN